ncbi:MAG: glycosyltransferase [Erysipelotrichaceae bacterium]|nr:glycosyltransferase [Erysipelotrichaceae bacterium]
MIKILYEGLSNNLGGIETFIYNLIQNIDNTKFEVSILLDENIETPYQAEYQKLGIHFYKISNRKNNYLRYLKDLKKVYQENHFDYIHINIMSYSLFERITYACKYSNAKIIVHSHNAGYKTGYYRTRILHQVGKIMLKPYNYLKVACGQAAGDFMFGEESFTIFNNGIDIDKFKYNQKNRQEIRKELSIKIDEFVVGLIAAFLPVKNHDFLLDIFNEMLKENSNLRLILVGEGPNQEKIKNKVNELKIQNNVVFLGKRMDVYKIYSALDIYIMPSFSEGLSISLLEAQVNGLKCYTSNNVDKNSNITGNVEFLSLDQSSEDWAKYILNQDNSRDEKVLNKIPDEFNAKKSYEEVYKFYQDNLK